MAGSSLKTRTASAIKVSSSLALSACHVQADGWIPSSRPLGGLGRNDVRACNEFQTQDTGGLCSINAAEGGRSGYYVNTHLRLVALYAILLSYGTASILDGMD